ncbi:hypothetical protein [Dictyobacter aurantiacus]|uniref:Nucleotidyltransferase n=1 Tax=Dictyobacter aurantiacus TaxID=1936993 RepID=A0A401ZNT4_9CHLR|nr:hypothetical protein [Dictyobacter aurantiacus]GCE08513.1 hypothetical protein KDAU_58420 [Dictyobacter aurantiacus]
MPDVRLQRDEVMALLEELGAELAARGIDSPVQIIVFGGVYMLMQIGNRLSTHDVDIVPLATGTDPRQEEKRRKIFRQASNAVASRHGLPRNWINDDGALFVEEIIQKGELVHWKTFQMLEIWLPELACMLALKLTAFRPLQDLDDTLHLCQALNVTTAEEAQAILDRYVPASWQQENLVDETLMDLFG